MIKHFSYIILIALYLLGAVSSASATCEYIKSGAHIATLPIHITGGYLFIDMPTEERDSLDQKIVRVRSYVLDVGISNDGNFLPFDSTLSVVGAPTAFRFPVSESHTLLASLVPSYAKEFFHEIDPNFRGVLGYTFLQRYITILDFEKNELVLYSTNTSVRYVSSLDTAAIHVPYLDDAQISYCHCHFPTIWLDVKAPPLKEGRVHLDLSANQSLLFKESFDPKTKEIVEHEQKEDSLAGKKFGGIKISEFIVGGRNIASRNPRRAIAPMPPRFKDLNITVIGTLAIDVLRKYKAVIIDPTLSKLMLVR